jgi:hypothetical protein
LVSFILHTLFTELQTKSKTEAESKYPTPGVNYSSAFEFSDAELKNAVELITT